VPWLLNWGIELPTTDEFLRGVLIKLEPIDITLQFPELTSIFDTVWTAFHRPSSRKASPELGW